MFTQRVVQPKPVQTEFSGRGFHGVVLRRKVNALKIGTPHQLRAGMDRLNAVEACENRATKGDFPAAEQVSCRVEEIACELGRHLYARRAANGMSGEWFMATPPLVTTEPEIDAFVELIEETFEKTAKGTCGMPQITQV